MAYEFKLPDLGEGLTEGEIARWLVAEGDEIDEDLDEAAAVATDAMLELMRCEFQLERADALALASVVVDLRVTQLVNGVRGVHAVLRHDAIRM